jgi:hypothetical protein
MRRLSGLVLIFAAAAVSACSTSPKPLPSPPPAPDLSEPQTLPAPGKSVLYTDCIGQAINRSAVARVSGEGVELLRFTCTGAPAQRFYEALGVPGGAAGSTWTEGGRSFRSTSAIRESLFGADYCSTGPGGAACQIHLNTGPFLTAAPPARG